MAFVNEFVSEEDISNYSLDSLRREFDPWGWQDGRPSVFLHSWTIDRDRNAYFIPVASVKEAGISGRGEVTTKKVCILSWQGIRVKLVIDRAPGSSFVTSDNPFRIIWELCDLELAPLAGVAHKDLLAVVKEALVTYGDQGVFGQRPNTLVQFKF